MRLLGRFCFAGLLVLCAMQVQALPPSMEADRKLLAAESAAKVEDWPAAVSAYEAYEAMGISKLPANFQFLYGHALFKAGKLDDAGTRIETYLNAPKASASKYYREALQDLNGIERERKKLVEDQAAAEAKKVAGAQADRLKRAEDDKLNAAWVSNTTTRSEYPARGRNSCGEVTRAVKELSTSARKISCSCGRSSIDHPAYRNKEQDACKATWQGNLILDGYEGNALPYSKREQEGDTDGWVSWEFKQGR